MVPNCAKPTPVIRTNQSHTYSANEICISMEDLTVAIEAAILNNIFS